MRDMNSLWTLVMVLFLSGLLLGVGILTLEKFGDTVEESATITDEQVTIASNTGQLAHWDITGISEFYNTTNESQSHTLTSANFTYNGAVTVASVNDGVWNTTYTYDKDTNATQTMDNSISALIPVASDWMPLIVTVAVLSIVLGLVLSSFAMRPR